MGGLPTLHRLHDNNWGCPTLRFSKGEKLKGLESVDIFDNRSGQLAGLHKTDVITYINDKNVGSVQDLASVLAPMDLELELALTTY